VGEKTAFITPMAKQNTKSQGKKKQLKMEKISPNAPPKDNPVKER